MKEPDSLGTVSEAHVVRVDFHRVFFCDSGVHPPLSKQVKQVGDQIRAKSLQGDRRHRWAHDKGRN